MKNKFLKWLIELPSVLPLYAFIAVLTGVLMLCLPYESLSLVLRISGVLLIVYSVLRIVSVFFTEIGFARAGMVLFSVIGILLLGFTLTVSPDGSGEVLALLVGIYLLLEGAIGLFALLIERRRYLLLKEAAVRHGKAKLALFAALSALSLIAGMVLISFRTGDTRLNEIFSAIALIFCGSERIISEFIRRAEIKKAESIYKERYIEAEFTDKTDRG